TSARASAAGPAAWASGRRRRGGAAARTGAGRRPASSCPGRGGGWASTTPASTWLAAPAGSRARGRRGGGGVGSGGRGARGGGGGAGVEAHVGAARAAVRSAAKRRALEEVARYFARRADYLGYAERLAPGQSIGSGVVEGVCKQVIGRRRKQTGARWQ